MSRGSGHTPPSRLNTPLDSDLPYDQIKEISQMKSPKTPTAQRANALLEAIKAGPRATSRYEEFRRKLRALYDTTDFFSLQLPEEQAKLIAEYFDVLSLGQSALSTLQMLYKCHDQGMKLRLLQQKGAAAAALKEVRQMFADMVGDTPEEKNGRCAECGQPVQYHAQGCTYSGDEDDE